MSELKDLPSVDRLLQTANANELFTRYGREMTVQAVRETLQQVRDQFTTRTSIPGEETILLRAGSLLERWFTPTLQPVLNATGVILHTNLGRSPLSHDSIQAVQEVMQDYSTLEFNLSSGKRGSRLIHAEQLLTRLTGAEAAMVVNNNASAVLLALSSLARRQRVIISRTQLVEIGGGFRIPDVMKQSGAKLVEVGSTNRVHLQDYEEALQEPAAILLRAHSSNFRIIGFTSEPDLSDLARLAKQHNVISLDDLGSGALLDTSRYGLIKEPMVQESVAAGVDVVCFSGDKLLGGPQAGILIGRKDLIDKIKKHPLARAVRADKMCLAALSATLHHYLKGEATEKVPIWKMISASRDELRERAERWQEQTGQGEVVESQSTVGGGSLPEEILPTFALRVNIDHPDQFLARLRDQNPPVIARIEGGSVLFDPRTIDRKHDAILVGAIKTAAAQKTR